MGGSQHHERLAKLRKLENDQLKITARNIHPTED